MAKKFNKKNLWWIIPTSLIILIGAIFLIMNIGESEDNIVRECNKGDIRNKKCDGYTIVFDQCEERVGGFFWAFNSERCTGDKWECNNGVCIQPVTPSGFRQGDDCSASTDKFHQKYSSSSPCKGDPNKACGVQCDGKYGVGCAFLSSKGTMFVDLRTFC